MEKEKDNRESGCLFQIKHKKNINWTQKLFMKIKVKVEFEIKKKAEM